MLQGSVVHFCTVRGDTVTRDEEVEISHESVMRRKEHANIPGYPGENQRLSLEVGEQQIERRGKKPECFGFKTK